MNRLLKFWRSPWLLLAAIALLYVAVAAVLLYSPWCMFTRLKMQINDYGTYVNSIWNTAHGQPFRYLMDQSYLRTHLSFTLALLAPVYWICDHAFTLAAVQWLCGVGGSLWMAVLATRRGFPPVLTAMLALFFLGYALTQSVLLCDFHGVCLYFVLFPWLYHELTNQRLCALVPLALIAGLREDAALLVIPMILYFAAKHRWRTGYVLAAAAFVYALLAMTCLFPWINGITLWERRADLLEENPGTAPLGTEISRRVIALFWLFLPALPLLLRRRTALPVLVFPAAALLVVMPSTNHFIHTLDKQYSAHAFTLMVLGVIEALALRRAEKPGEKFTSRMVPYLFICTIAAHFGLGHIPSGTQQTRDLIMPASPYGLTAIHAASHLPKTGVLLTTSQLSGLCANRRDLVIFDRPHKRSNDVEIIFAGWTELFDREGREWIRRLRAGEFGATYFDHNYAILERGAPPGLAAEVLLAHDNLDRTIVFTKTARHRGDLAYTATWQGTRHWSGKSKYGPAIISHGSTVELAAGKWTAMFRLKSREPKQNVCGNRGLLELYAQVKDPPFVSVEVDRTTAGSDELTWQKVPFTLSQPTQVEVRVLSGDAELWLDRVIFVPQAESAR